MRYITRIHCREVPALPILNLVLPHPVVRYLVALHPVVTVVGLPHPVVRRLVALHPVVTVVGNESQILDGLARKTGIGEATFISLKLRRHA
jgi:hypothetical protein